MDYVNNKFSKIVKRWGRPLPSILMT